MINALYITAEDGIRSKNLLAMITEGQPVALNASGELIGATAGTGIYGVSKLDSNAIRDFAFGEFGAFGTGKLTVVTKGLVQIQNSVYNEIEVNTQMGVNSTPTTISLLANVVWAVNDRVYVTAAGLISNAAAGDSFGKVTAIPSQTPDGSLEIEVDCAGNSNVGAQGNVGATGATGAGPTGATGAGPTGATGATGWTAGQTH